MKIRIAHQNDPDLHSNFTISPILTQFVVDFMLRKIMLFARQARWLAARFTLGRWTARCTTVCAASTVSTPTPPPSSSTRAGPTATTAPTMPRSWRSLWRMSSGPPWRSSRRITSISSSDRSQRQAPGMKKKYVKDYRFTVVLAQVLRIIRIDVFRIIP